MPGDLCCVGDDAGGLRHRSQQVVGIADGQALSDGILVLKSQHVPRSAFLRQCSFVQCVTDVEKLLMGGLESLVRHVGDPRSGYCSQDRQVAQPTEGLLEVGLDEVGEISVPGPPRVDGITELGQAAARQSTPVAEDRRLQASGEILVAGDAAHVEQPQHDPQVAGRHATGVRHGAHAVIHAYAGVPHGVPQPIGRLTDGRLGSLGDQQEQVEVTARGELGTAEATHGNERAAALGGSGLREDPGEPVVGQVCERTATRRELPLG